MPVNEESAMKNHPYSKHIHCICISPCFLSSTFYLFISDQKKYVRVLVVLEDCV